MIVFAFATVAGACDYRKPRTSATFGIDDKHTWLMDAFPLDQSGQAAYASARCSRQVPLPCRPAAS